MSLDAGNLAVNVNGSAVPVALAAQPCRQVTINNNSAVAVEVQQDAAGVYFPLAAGSSFTFRGITNTSALAVRRVDLGAVAVVLPVRWEL
jgi:hypothetical protein